MSLSSGVSHAEYVQRLQVLWADIQADEAFAEIPNTVAGSIEIAAAYNLDAVPEFIVWQNVTSQQCRKVQDWAENAGLIERRQNTWAEMRENGYVETSDANVRDGLIRIFGDNSVTRAAVLDIAKRPATRAERLFVTGTGTRETPGDLVFAGNLPWQDVHNARNM